MSEPPAQNNSKSTAPPTASAGMATAGPALVRYAAAVGPGITNLVRIEGTSSVHNWQVEGHLLGGSAEFEAGFLAPARAAGLTANAVGNARVTVFIPVRSLRSVEKNGAPYSDAMDEIMYTKLRAEDFRRISYTLSSLNLDGQVPSSGTSFLYQATGNLCVAGETNVITMPVTASPTADGKIQFAGSVRVKMTGFKITPPAPSFGGLSIKTGDEVTLRFVWSVKPVEGLEARK